MSQLNGVITSSRCGNDRGITALVSTAAGELVSLRNGNTVGRADPPVVFGSMVTLSHAEVRASVACRSEVESHVAIHNEVQVFRHGSDMGPSGLKSHDFSKRKALTECGSRATRSFASSLYKHAGSIS